MQVLKGKIVMSPDSVQTEISKLKTNDDTGPIVLIKAYKKVKLWRFRGYPR